MTSGHQHQVQSAVHPIPNETSNIGQPVLAIHPIRLLLIMLTDTCLAFLSELRQSVAYLLSVFFLVPCNSKRRLQLTRTV